MIINRKRINSIKPYRRYIPPGSALVAGAPNPTTEKLREVGFSPALQNGETILPAPIGPVSLYNAEGKELIHKDQPMETAYQTREWSWTEWHGRDRVDQSKLVDIPYLRYPRSFLPPPALEFTLATDSNGKRVVRTAIIENWNQNEDAAKHAINLLLEIFGECNFYDSSMTRFIDLPIKRLNWNVLPPGQRPYPTLKKELAPLLERISEGKQAFTEHRLETINDHKPDFAAVGMGGFRGYVVLGFTSRNLFVLESLYYGNATYVFGERWEELSKKTKAEILNQNLQKTRFVHHADWAKDIRGLFRAKTETENLHFPKRPPAGLIKRGH